MSNPDMKRILKKIHDIQTNPEHKVIVPMPCPRCGQCRMDSIPTHNALSRHATVYICDLCGTDEALRDYSHNVLPLEEWACASLIAETD